MRARIILCEGGGVGEGHSEETNSADVAPEGPDDREIPGWEGRTKLYCVITLLLRQVS